VKPDGIAQHVYDEAAWLEANREKICKGCKALEARIDDFVSVYLRTYYKLANLK